MTQNANWQNRTLFHGDNLAFLRAMNSSSVDLIAMDPPFNKGRDFHATPDSLASGARFQDRWTWKDDVHPEWVDTIRDDHPNLWAAIMTAKQVHSESMGAFCCFMGVRLLAMHRILKPSGSIYLHCDQAANSYIRMLMDAVFGAKNLKNEVIWSYRRWATKSTCFQKTHDNILFYTKGGCNQYWSEPMEPKGKNTVKFKQKAEFVDDGNGGVKRINTIDKSTPVLDTRMRDVWEMPILAPSARERLGYPTQKPIALYERIIKASCPPNGIVLDPFAGCATTCAAAERLGMQWVGIDLWDKSGEVVEERMRKECGEGTFISHKITFTKDTPVRTDNGEVASEYLKTPLSKHEPEGKRMSRDEMKNALLEEHGNKCQGCDHVFHDHRHLELDHNTPKSDGGINHISNRILLCGPCNRMKSNQYTLSGLRRRNKKEGYMASRIN